MTNEEIMQSIQNVFEKVGMGILEEPLRFEAFMRDLHPQNPAEISVLTESLLSGSIGQLMKKDPLHECIATLSARGGIAPRYADWVMNLWLEVLPASAMLEQQEEQQQFSTRWEGTVENVLGQYRDNHKRD